MRRKRYGWQHGLLFFLAVRAASTLLKLAVRKRAHPGPAPQGDRELYNTERLPVFAPPPKAFPVAWTLNNICTIAGGLYVLNLPRRTRGRLRFLRLQGASWTLFSVFEAAYFGLRSPINAEIVTVLYTAATLASLDAALCHLQDRKAAASLATTLAWLALANPVGLAVAAWNHDPFWDAGPFLQPKPGWAKEPRRAIASETA